MAAILKMWHGIENTTSSVGAMHINLNKIPDKFYSDPIWNDRALSLKRSPQQQQQQQQQQQPND